VNAAVLSDSGGTCVCPTADLCLTDPTYLACVGDVQRDLITGTAAIAALSSFLMGLLANLPVGLAPGLGLNAYVSRAAAYIFHVVAQRTVNASFSSLMSSWGFMEAGKSPTGKRLLLSSWRGACLPFITCSKRYNPVHQVVIRHPVAFGSPSVARPHHTTVPCPCSGSWNRAIHRVSSICGLHIVADLHAPKIYWLGYGSHTHACRDHVTHLVCRAERLRCHRWRHSESCRARRM
jgi:hypothetical protein